MEKHPSGIKEPEVLDMRAVKMETSEERSFFPMPDLNPQNPLLVLNHFDYEIESLKVYNARMLFLARLRQKYVDKQIIIISTKNNIASPEVKEVEKKSEEKSSEHPKKRFQEEVLSNFMKIVYPVEPWIRLNSS